MFCPKAPVSNASEGLGFKSATIKPFFNIRYQFVLCYRLAVSWEVPNRSPADGFLTARSVENLSSIGTNFGLRSGSGRRLPEAPSALPTTDIPSTGVRQPAFSRQRRARRAQAGGYRSQSVGRLPREIPLNRNNDEFLQRSAHNYYRLAIAQYRLFLGGRIQLANDSTIS
ncbi:unnamed protein product [Anisakis simplex]|uniref:Uncharacterized protein n=1 Tax=Anisakis simplex TaxID=6269 RepID=A0A0M3JG90_ANISI|nr:unnamed protein product [Anisakis simplex]